MNRESTKSIVLSGLVLLSILFTWNIWTYQSNYEPLRKSGSPRNIAIASSFEINDVIRPYMTIYQHNGESYGSEMGLPITNMYRFFRDGKYVNVVQVSDDNKPPSQGSNDAYEIIFPGPISAAALQQLFSFETERLTYVLGNKMVDRIKIYVPTDNSKPVTALFMNSTTPVFYSSVSNVQIQAMQNIYNDDKGKGAFDVYQKVKLKKKVIYMPTNEVVVPVKSFVYETEQLKDFVPALFNDPENTIYSKGSYSDGTHQLEQKGNVFQFINIATNTVKADKDPLIQSFEFVNSHSGWTDDFIYSEMFTSASNESEVVFRMKEGNYPVFSTATNPSQYISSINLLWKDNNLHELNRTLINLNDADLNSFGSETKNKVTLNSGTEIVNELDQLKSVRLADIEDIRIGYLLDPQQISTTIVELNPMWFFKMDGRWLSVEEVIHPKKDQGGVQ